MLTVCGIPPPASICGSIFSLKSLVKSFPWTHQILTMIAVLRHDPSHDSQIKREQFLLESISVMAHCNAQITWEKLIHILGELRIAKLCACGRRGTLPMQVNWDPQHHHELLNAEVRNDACVGFLHLYKAMGDCSWPHFLKICLQMGEETEL